MNTQKGTAGNGALSKTSSWGLELMIVVGCVDVQGEAGVIEFTGGDVVRAEEFFEIWG